MKCDRLFTARLHSLTPEVVSIAKGSKAKGSKAEGKRLTDIGLSIWRCPNYPDGCYITTEFAIALPLAVSIVATSC